jgi:hypothetical protein
VTASETSEPNPAEKESTLNIATIDSALKTERTRIDGATKALERLSTEGGYTQQRS